MVDCMDYCVVLFENLYTFYNEYLIAYVLILFLEKVGK